MKRVVLFIALIFSAFSGWSQNAETILTEPQVIELSISTPQPRLKETFQISIDINHLRGNIFKSLAGKLQISDHDLTGRDNGLLTMNVTAIKKGKNEIGPLEFYLDKTKYTTNKIIYEVIDPLPQTDRGLWFRKVVTSDSTFCIIIEQRIPASTKTTKTSDNSISFTTEPEINNIVKFKPTYSIAGVSGANSHSTTNFSSVEVNNEQKQFMYGFSVYHFSINDKKAKIKITKDKFDNIPPDFTFEDIIIQ
jgi:hypothetical protein